MAGVLLQWLNACFASKGAPSEDLYAVVALPNNFIPLLFRAREQSLHLAIEQANQIVVLGEAWLQVYGVLAIACALLDGRHVHVPPL